jgi:hypothetical protein
MSVNRPTFQLPPLSTGFTEALSKAVAEAGSGLSSFCVPLDLRFANAEAYARATSGAGAFSG